MRPRKRRQWPLLVGACILAACAVILFGKYPFESAPTLKTSVPDTVAATPVPTPTPRVAVEFRMLDLDRGWVKYADGMVQTTDGGAHWQEAPGTEVPPVDGGADAMGSETIAKLLSLEAATGSTVGSIGTAGNSGAAGVGGTSIVAGAAIASPSSSGGGDVVGGASGTAGAVFQGSLASVKLEGISFAVKQSQFVTPKIGWVLLTRTTDSINPLLLTVNGGQTWVDGMTEDAKAIILGEKAHLTQLKAEASLYIDETGAKAIMSSSWKLIPEQASPGDIVLVRHREPDSITWQGKTYTLQPYEAGYFTYLPIPMSVKAGTYPIGDQTLTIKAKKFETQYLKVTEQMESMKQDTARINADQKKIDLARSKSEPTFLFRGPFVKPIEGILTTPYGYTRYVNGKYDSSHMAIDLAAKEGTPIKATNDGVVALAEPLYLTGNSIYIDHGMGLFSQYAHLSELRVKTGDRVKQGDIIGFVGTTGFSTGPHLHFTFWAHNIQANPDLFFNTTPFQWGK